MHRRLVFFWMIVILAVSGGANAQGNVKLESLSIELWAEYDQPSMLVINEFIVSQGTPLPAKVTLRFPRDGNLIAVAFNANGQLINAPFEGPAQQGDWQTVTLNVESYIPYRIEYYQALERDGNKRSFDFKWFGDYSVNSFSLTLIIPADSTEVNPLPILPQFEPSPDGRHLIGTDIKEGLKMRNSYQFEIEYERITDTLAAPNAASQVQPSEPLGEDTPGRTSVDQLPWIIGGVGLAMIGFAMIFYWRSLRAGGSTSSHIRRRRGKTSEPTPGENQDVYCHQCGTRAVSGDRFCRTCGSKLRAE